MTEILVDVGHIVIGASGQQLYALVMHNTRSGPNFFSRAGRKDRGLLSKPDATGKPMWHVRLYHEGRERRFGSFLNKTQARDFYEKAKQEQKSERFFPERYQRGGYDLVEDMLSRYLATLPRNGKTPSTIADERYYRAWWAKRLSGKRVNQLTPDLLG